MEKPAAKIRLGRHSVALLLLFGYVMMTLITLEQARTISSQRELIRVLFQDSIELSAERMRQTQAQHR
jgi:hypothetical protein